MLNRTTRARQRGLSVIEMTMAVGVMVILGAMAVPSFSAWRGNTRIRTSAEAISTGLSLVLTERDNNAATGSASVTINSRGRPDTNSTSLRRIDIDVPTSIVPAAQSRELRIALNDFGQTRLCDPNAASGAPDTLIVRFAGSVRGIRPVTLTANAANNATAISVDSAYGVLADGLLLLVNGSNACALRRVTTMTSATALALSSIGNLVCLASNSVNLEVTMKYWPAVHFHATREHGQKLAHEDR